jgi:hypothetical protein
MLPLLWLRNIRDHDDLDTSHDDDGGGVAEPDELTLNLTRGKCRQLFHRRKYHG